jgi:PAS domain S-box-containing protein
MAASLQDGVATLDTAGRFTFVNEVTVRRSGHPLDWWLGRHHNEVVPVEERERLERIFAAVLRKEKVDPYELAYPTADGRTVNIEATAAPITRNGEVVGVATVNRDVTERRRLVRAARETADELRAVLDNSPDAIAGECDGVLAYANQRFARLFGYDSAAEVIGRSAVEFDAPEDRELLAGYTRLREQGKDAPASYSFRGLRRDGTTMPLTAVISTYRSLGRLHILAFIREVTAGGGTEPVPGAGEERHRRPADAAPEGLMVIQNEVVVLANRAAAEMLGYTHPTELVGMRGTNLVASEDLPRLMGRGALVSTGAGGFGPLMVRFAVRGGASIPAEVIGASTSWRGKAAIQVMVKPLSVARA